MKFILTWILLLIVVLLNADYEIIEATADRYLIRITSDDYKLIDSEGFKFIQYQGTRPDAPGVPDLPAHLFHIGVPPDGDIEVRIVSENTETLILDRPIIPVPEIIKSGKTHEFIYRIDEDLYFNRDISSLQQKEKTRFRHYQVVPLLFSPFRYDHLNRELMVYLDVLLEIRIKGNTSFRNRIADNFGESCGKFILNYEQAVNWVTVPEIVQVRMPFELSEFWYRFDIPGSADYMISGTDLQELPAFCDPGSIRILRMQIDEEGKKLEELPIFIVDDNGRLDDVDRIYFSVDKNGPIDAKSGSAYLWLTFGGRFADEPSRRADPPDGSDLNSISNLLVAENKLLQSRDNIHSILIHPAEFYTQTLELAELHQTYYGLESELVDQQEIFDLYSGGIADRDAIKDFLEFRFSEHPELEYVILMGSGTQNWEVNSDKNRIMTYDGKDDKFVAFNSSFPELKIARFPAQNSTDMSFLIERSAQYIENPVHGWWRNTVMLQPDDENKSGGFEGTSDTAGMNHTMRAEMTANLINNSVIIDKLYAIEYELDPYQNKPDVRAEIIDRLSEGRLIWYFIGHGDHDVLGDEEYFRSSLHLRLLENGDKLPLFLAASCSVGEFDKLEYDSTAERLLFHENGGAIASIAASRACGPIPNTELMFGLIEESVNLRHNVGTALFNAKLMAGQYIGTGNLYNLLGDPLLPIYPPDRFLIANPPDTLQARQTGSVSGNFGSFHINSSEGNLKVFDSDYFTYYRNQLSTSVYHIGYRKYGNTYFNGVIEVDNGNYNGNFIVPDDIRGFKEIAPLIDFYDNKGFFVDGDHTSDINKNYRVKIISPAGEQQAEVDSVRVVDNQTIIVLKENLEGTQFSIDNFSLYLDTGGRIITYVLDDEFQQEHLSYFYPITMDKIPLNVENSGPPQVQLMIDSRQFQDGDYVSTRPLIIADIEDENGINILGSSGHKILILLDEGFEPIDVSSGFVYDLNSYTKGTLTWQLPLIAEGHHTIQLIVFDNFNLPRVTTVGFITRKSSKIAIEQMLPYPNPMKDDGYFTFVVTEESEVTITIYTITGKKIRTLDRIQCDAGYNQIYWNGRDEEGDELANNTYFYKIKAKQSGLNRSTEKIGKFIILK